MKKIFTLLTAVALGSASFGQVFQSDLSSWAGGEPTDWMGTKTNLISGGGSITEINSAAANYGTSVAQVVNDQASAKRLSTQTVAVTAGETYEVKMWVTAVAGEMTTRMYDLTNSAYGTFNSNYIDVAGANNLMISQTVTIPAGCSDAEFIIYFRNTGAVGVGLDSVDISTLAVSYTPKTISEIQTTVTGDSPELGNFIETSGVVTAVKSTSGYWIQDGTGAWSGVYIKDNANTPAMGDSVTVQGQVSENFSATQLENIASYTLNAAPSVIPTPTILSTTDINSMEEYEGVLIQAVDVECTSTDYGFGQWVINTDPAASADSLRVDDDIFNFGAQVLGNHYVVTGIGHYSYGVRKILPRMAADVVDFVSINEHVINANIFPNPANTNVTISGINGTVAIYSINGKLVYNAIVNGTSTINLEALNSGLYIIEVIENNTTANYKLIVE